jgi:exodeoxyribonuclease VII large subunit
MTSFFDLPFEEPGEPAPAPEPAAPARRVFTVSQLNARIRQLLEETFVEVWVEGELSNCRVWNTGHM